MAEKAGMAPTSMEELKSLILDSNTTLIKKMDEHSKKADKRMGVLADKIAQNDRVIKMLEVDVRSWNRFIPQRKRKPSFVVYLLLAFSYLLILILFGIVLYRVANLPAEVTKMHKQLQETKDFFPCGSRTREWEYFDGGCYYFGIEAVTWDTAKAHCEERSSKLVVINEEAKQNFIESQTRGERYWIGLSDKNVEGEWKWIDGTDYRTTFKKWTRGEPNDAGEREDCAQIHAVGEWNDVGCNSKSFYVCEKPLPS
ncbi:hepatic lectin-like [Elgaria multicarinata webbii]|uniref:hepatic lectin-like n=1 Tax=Elgaria multicarinata webbii TaxID=159646 RepID=UPI002FCCC253